VLILILIGVYCFKIWFVPFYDTVGVPSQEELDKALAVFEPEEEKEAEDIEETYASFSFDPNLINKDSLLLLGMDENLARRFINYRSAIGEFRDAQQVSRVYGLDSALFQRIAPLMTFKAVTENGNSEQTTLSFSHVNGNEPLQEREIANPGQMADIPKEKQVLDINTAGENEFRKVNGIGQVLATRIVKYRKLLGGFLNSRQLYEVYGIDSTQVSFENWDFKVDLQAVQYISINELDEKALARHPYVSWKQAKVIVNFRNQHGVYRSLKDFSQLKAFSNSEISQLAGYLEFD